MYNNILVIADQDVDQRTALQKARSIAVSDDSNITVLGFIKTTESDSKDSKLEALEKAIAEELSGVANTSCEVVSTDDIAAYCKSYTAEHKTDLVIKTGHRTESMFHTPLDFQLVRELKCAVMISTQNKWRAEKNVMVTIDIESENKAQIALNKKVAAWAKGWCELQGCDLHAGNCIHIAEALSELDIVSKDEVRMKKDADLRDKLGKFLSSEGVSCTSIVQEPGVPERILPRLANRLKADLVVLGSVGRKGVKGALMGNTAEKTMRKLRTDLVVIHPD